MKNKKSYFIVFFVILFIGFCVYHIRTTNHFFMGSNTEYYKDVFGYPNSEWICKEPKIELKVYDLQVNPQSGFEYISNENFIIMKLESNGIERNFVIVGGHGNIEIYEPECLYPGEGKGTIMPEVFYGFADYKKDFFSGEVTSFTIYDIRKDEIFNNQYKKLKFKRKT